jgi:hypothetical protein
MAKTIPPIVLKPEASRIQRLWYDSLHVLVIAAIASAPLAEFKPLLLIVLLVLIYARYQGYGVDRHNQVIEAKIKESGYCRIKLANGEWVTANLRQDSVLTPWLILLRFNIRNRWRRPVMVLFQDALPDTELRQLRILLKHGSFLTRSNSSR